MGLVKGVGFDSWRRVGTVLPSIRVYNLRDVDEIIVVDICATNEERKPDIESVEEFSADCFVPLTIGGGVTTIEDFRALLRAGADKVAVNTAFFENPDIVSAAAEQFGSQCVVVSLDAKKQDGGHFCYSHCGTKPTGMEVTQAAKKAEDSGAGEILLTSIERDGAMEGYDLELIQKVTSTVNIPVIASGGAGKLEDFSMAVKQGASAVAAASLFHFTQTTPMEVKQALAEQQIPVRLAVRNSLS